MVTIESLTKEQLKDFLQQQELSTTGNMAELVARLTEHVKASGVVLQFTNDNEELRGENEELRKQIRELSQMVQQVAINQNNGRNNQNSTSEMPSKDRNAHSIREIAEVLPEFDPTNEDSITATQFVERVEAVMSVYAWPEKSVLLAVYSRLKGVARMWVDASPRMHATWKEFSNELVTEFGRRHNLSEMAITKYAREGLKHRELQMAIASQKFVSVKEMREACENFLQNCIKINEKPFHNAGESEQRIQSFIKAKNVMCYNCGKSGHLSVNCARLPKRPRCIDCNKVHPKNEQQNCGKPSAFVRKTNIIDNKFLKKITIGGKQAIAFIDTGSECNMVRLTFANDIGGTRSKNLLTIGGFGGSIERSEIQIDTDLKIDEVEKPLTCTSSKIFKFEDKVKTTCKINKLSPITEDDVCMDTVNSGSKGKLLEVMNEFRECFATAPSESSYASPMLLVKKKNGEHRLCVDYRRINQFTRKECYPMPNIEESLQEATKYRIHISLDLNCGYYQIPIERNSRKYTAVEVPDGLYEVKRMLFGLKNAPVLFLQLMAKIKTRLEPSDMIHYMDDMLVGGNDEEELLGNSEVGSNGITPGEIKTEVIRNFSMPTTQTEVWRYLGLTGYFRKFIPGYAIISEPLRQLLKKNAVFKWADQQTNAFLSLNEALTTGPVLTGYRVEADHQVHTDASAIGLAGVLLQNDNGDWKPVAYFSRSTTPLKRKYHSYELETLAVVESVDRFKYNIYGKSFTVITDYNAVKLAMQKREMIPRIARWWLRIQDYDLIIKHRSEQRMTHVDALSRMPNEDGCDLEEATLRVWKAEITEADCLYSMQLQDSKLQQVVMKIEEKDAHIIDDYKIINGRLYKRYKNQRYNTKGFAMEGDT
ncbi:uncharacterized protein LOC119675411 [Teleopsis dalmanni]|uniref:uncharacterized protein LOC119675411 n=1 Tax=Teleopsis dalmanni TaxID=139649 RepID=UPI0018CE7CF1|nr:uncharacterized protein LOC119675411 [Teleopsis dalmanni]